MNKHCSMVSSLDRVTSNVQQYTRDDLPRLYDKIGKFDAKAAFEDRLGLWEQISLVVPDHIALHDPAHDGGVKLTYSEAAHRITVLAGGLQALGLSKDDKIGLFSENSYRWALLDGAALKAGAIDVVRGALGPVAELAYILKHSESKACIVQDSKLLSALVQESGPSLELSSPDTAFVVVMYPNGKSGVAIKEECGMLDSSVRVVTMEELSALGVSASSEPLYEFVDVREDDVALLYTSGTTGRPKGVVLTHGNLLHQMMDNSFAGEQPMEPCPGDVQLCILPCWHIFERFAEYYGLIRGATLVYSGVKTFKKDLAAYSPQLIIAVPRLYENIYQGSMQKFAAGSVVQRAIVAVVMWISRTHMLAKRRATNTLPMTLEEQARWQQASPLEKSLRHYVAVATQMVLMPLQRVGDKLVWSKVRQALGGKVKCLISGGSKLPLVIDDFYEMAGINMIVGYGLTETSPVICNRAVEHNVAGSCGKPPLKTELLIKDVESGNELGRVGKGAHVAGEPWTHLTSAHSSGDVGVVWVRGPQVTKGYYRNPEANAAAFDREGFFNTGDLGRIDPVTGCLFITGRAKDTIVLMNGENVEPEPLEEALIESPLISQAMLVGQDAKALSGVIVLDVHGCAAAGLLDREKVAQLARLIPAGPKDPTPDSAQLEKERLALASSSALHQAILTEANEMLKSKPFFREWERLGNVTLLLEPFTVENGLLTMTLKVKRDSVIKRYKTGP
eukprot:CAMPEP_0179424750 /NCGR_PEP_ID=MMETSP0799-20121207/11774_1 /TAXON_ID=46947 /ORGANISM="Geminigera cryophila, Strain CCMP2564" /LENGTH=732 /DNA_ID=CAMNT_0021199261 /DNA_START=224 /DNA_END=2422 /DNA_ORIENTATION=-